MSPSLSSWSRQVAATPAALPRFKRWLGVAVLGLVVMASALYLVTTNAVATKGYEIKELQSDLNTLRQESGKLEVEATKLQSLGIIEQMVPSNSFVAVEKIEYLAAALPPGGVAVK